jgi:putative hemolysin
VRTSHRHKAFCICKADIRSQSSLDTPRGDSKVLAAMRYRPALVAAFLACSSSSASTLNPVHQRADKKGAVASESKICTEIGIELIRRGVSIQTSECPFAVTHVYKGNAADALVGSQLCVGVIGPSFKPGL